MNFVSYVCGNDKTMNANDFSRMILPVYEIEHGSDLRLRFMPIINDCFPSFAKYEEMTKFPPEHINRVIRYIAYMYDRNSPMIHLYPDYARRVRECAALAGFDLKKEKEDFMEKVYSQNDPAMAEMAFEYIKHQNSEDWATLCSNSKMFYDNIKDIMATGVSYKDQKQKLDAQVVKAKMREENKNIVADNRALYDQIFVELATKTVAKSRATTAESRTRSRRK